MEQSLGSALVDGGTAAIAIGNGSTRYGAATRRGDWVDIAVPVDAEAIDPWTALAINAAVRGSARLTLAEDRLQLRTERRWPAGGHSVRADLEEALHAVLLPPIQPRRWPAIDDVVWAAWNDLVSTSSWKTSTREGQRIAIDLETGERGGQATARPHGSALQFEARLAAPDDRLCRLAVGCLLLAATDGIRLVRAAREADQIYLASAVSAGSDRDAVDRSLAALRLAVRLAGREVAALASDAATARRYLELTPSKERSCQWNAEPEFSCST